MNTDHHMVEGYFFTNAWFLYITACVFVDSCICVRVSEWDFN